MSTPLNNSILKAVSILDLFDDKRQELTARDVAELGDMNGITAGLSQTFSERAIIH